MRVLAALALFALAGCGIAGLPGTVFWAGGGPAVVSMNPAAWTFRYGSGISGAPQAAPGGFAFTFPTSGDVDYLTTNVTIAAKGIAHAVAKIDALSGAPTFAATDGCTPAAFRIMLEVRNDDGSQEDGRWWARLNGPALSTPGSYVMDVSIADLSQWSNVLGHVATDRPAQFKAAMGNLGAVGFTFGACAFGHGVTVAGGSARMTVTAFAVD